MASDKLDNRWGFIDLIWPGVLLVEQKSAGCIRRPIVRRTGSTSVPGLPPSAIVSSTRSCSTRRCASRLNWRRAASRNGGGEPRPRGEILGEAGGPGRKG